MPRGEPWPAPSPLSNLEQGFRDWEATLKRVASMHQRPSLGWYELQALALTMLLRFAR
jgi:hypothetical protein